MHTQCERLNTIVYVPRVEKHRVQRWYSPVVEFGLEKNRYDFLTVIHFQCLFVHYVDIQLFILIINTGYVYLFILRENYDVQVRVLCFIANVIPTTIKII